MTTVRYRRRRQIKRGLRWVVRTARRIESERLWRESGGINGFLLKRYESCHKWEALAMQPSPIGRRLGLS